MSEHELWNELGNLYFLSGAYNQAVHAYERSIQADTNFGRPYSNLALTYVQQGKYEEAVELYRRSIELLVENQERAISWNRLGSVYRHLKDYSKAVIAFQEADLLDPRSADDFPATTEVRQQVSEPPSSVLNDPVSEPERNDVIYEAELPVNETEAELTAQEPEALVIAEASTPEPIVEVEPSIEGPQLSLPEQAVVEEQAPAEEPEPLVELVLPVAEPELVSEAMLPVEEPEPLVELVLPVAEAEPLIDAMLPVEEPEPLVELMLPAELPETLVEAMLPITEPEPVAESEPSPVELEPVMAIAQEQEPEPELEWWDVDEERMQAATNPRPVASISDDDRNASWTPSDPSQFQQDLSQMPDTGSLTTWGDADFDDDFELFPSPGSDSERELPDSDGERIATWIPLPEEAPINLDEVWIPPFLEEEEPEPDFPLEWNEAPAYHVLNSIDFGPILPPTPAAAEPVEYLQRSQQPLAVRQGSVQQAWDQLDVDVAVEERPSDIALGTQQSLPALEPMTVQEAIEQDLPQPEAVIAQEAPEPSLNAQPPALPDSERDEDEMHEIEMGIAKFRRVVQVNPRNAHAWDALGTLYKSAGLYKDAILAYQQAISNDSSKSLYFHHLGLVYACEGRDEAAIGAFQRVLEIDPDYSLAHATLGGYYRKMGLDELAQQHIGKAMKSIFDSENEYNRACLEAICGNADQAIELLGVALKNKQTYVDWILRDPDLDFIRQDPRFKQLISDYTR
jgi:tetratricopeptide (TPR) repeat protein